MFVQELVAQCDVDIGDAGFIVFAADLGMS
jgi:hypothetical protein